MALASSLVSGGKGEWVSRRSSTWDDGIARTG
jgi:hypothetical protein